MARDARASAPTPHIDELAGDRGGRRHGRRHQMRAAFIALAALEITVRGRGAAFAGLELVGIHGEAHRAAGLAPVEAGLDEYLVQALGLGLLLHQAGAGYDHRTDVAIDRLVVRDARDVAEVFDARVGARSNEYPIDRDIGYPFAAVQSHIVERAHRGVPFF